MSEPSAQKDDAQRDEHEPSMDDILASIRKIISEDDVAEGAAVDTSPAEVGEVSSNIGEQAELISPENAASMEVAADDIDFHFEDLLIPDMGDNEDMAVAAEQTPPNIETAEEETASLKEGEEGAKSASRVAEQHVDLDTLNLEADILTEFAAFDETLDLVAVSDVNMTLTPEADISDEASAANPIEPVVPDMSTTADMDVVKSLMEDLTEDTSLDVQADDILAEALDNIDLDNIDLAIDETDTPSIDTVNEPPTSQQDVDMLLEIARRAEADAQHLQEAAKTSASPSQTLIPTLPDPDVKETMDMPPAAQPVAPSDRILDDVTETATTDAFASLTKAVEEQAVVNESGPRIGDLVQEAMRPMIKEWLDANLKGIVERAVAKEVKRIASGK